MVWYLPAFAVCWWLAAEWVLVDEDAARLARGVVGNAAFGFMFAMVGVGSQAGGAALDAQTRKLRLEAAVRAAAGAAVAERKRVDGLVHDNVLAALLAAGRGSDPDTVHKAVTQALVALRNLATPTTGSMTAREAAELLKRRCVNLDEGTRVSTQCRLPSLLVPTTAVEALCDVAAEALRNSIRHAGERATRSVEADFGSALASVTVCDDGAGFYLTAIPPNRLGIAVSMRERLSRIPGAALRIVSSPGAGTIVRASVPVDLLSSPGEAAESAKHGTAPDVVGLHSWGAAAVAAIFLAADAARPFEAVRDGVLTAYYLAAVTLLATGAALLLRRSPDPMPTPRAWALAGCAVTAAVCNTAAASALDAKVANVLWAWAPSTMLMAFLAVRGRFGTAWAGQAGMTAAYCLWFLRYGAEFTGDFVLQLLLWNLTLLVVCSLYARTLRRQVDHANTANKCAVALAAESARARAALRERDAQLHYLDATARPLLEHLAHVPQLDSDTRVRALLLEARLRDRIRARNLATEPILDAAQAARARGVRVTLLDDGALDHADPALVAHVRNTVAAHLDNVPFGRITARVMPPGRETICTIAATTEDKHTYTELPTPPPADAALAAPELAHQA